MIGAFLVLSLIGLSLFYLQNLALFPSVQLRLLSVLVFYVSLRPAFALAFALALVLGLLQDSFALTPLGMHVNGALALVAAGRFARRRFLLAGPWAQVLACRHVWPPPAICARALGWLELEAMAGGFRARDEALIVSIMGAEEDVARALEQAGDLEWAAVAYEGTAPLARVLHPASAIPGRLEALVSSKEFRRQVGEEEKRARDEGETLARFGQALARIRDGAPSEIFLERMLDDLGLDRIIGITHPGNVASQRVLRKIGMVDRGWGRYYDRRLRLFAVDNPQR